MMNRPGEWAPHAPGVQPAAPPPADGRSRGNAPGGGALAVVLVAQAALVLGFFVLSIVVVWIRAGRKDEPAAAPPVPAWTALPDAPVVAPGVPWVAVVSETKGLPGVVREQASFQSAKLGTVAAGTEVEVLDARENGRRWYRVRARSGALPLSGWMHGDILRPK